MRCNRLPRDAKDHWGLWIRDVPDTWRFAGYGTHEEMDVLADGESDCGRETLILPPRELPIMHSSCCHFEKYG